MRGSALLKSSSRSTFAAQGKRFISRYFREVLIFNCRFGTNCNGSLTGSLTGFGGGIENKSILLNLEQGAMVGAV